MCAIAELLSAKWDLGTPFGLPVVPEVYRIIEQSVYFASDESNITFKFIKLLKFSYFELCEDVEILIIEFDKLDNCISFSE